MILKAFWGISAQNKYTLFSQAKTFHKTTTILVGKKDLADMVYFSQIEPDPLNVFCHRERKKKNFAQKLKEFKPKQVWVCRFVTHSRHDK